MGGMSPILRHVFLLCDLWGCSVLIVAGEGGGAAAERHWGNQPMLSDVDLLLKRDPSLLGLTAVANVALQGRDSARSGPAAAGVHGLSAACRAPLLCYTQCWLSYPRPNDYV